MIGWDQNEAVHIQAACYAVPLSKKNKLESAQITGRPIPPPAAAGSRETDPTHLKQLPVGFAADIYCAKNRLLAQKPCPAAPQLCPHLRPRRITLYPRRHQVIPHHVRIIT